MQNGDSVLVFDGIDDYIEIPDSPDFSVATTGQLTVSAWIRPDVLTFPIAQSTGYVHWMGKGEPGQREWVFRMYNEQTKDDPPQAESHQLLCIQPGARTGNWELFSGAGHPR